MRRAAGGPERRRAAPLLLGGDAAVPARCKLGSALCKAPRRPLSIGANASTPRTVKRPNSSRRQDQSSSSFFKGGTGASSTTNGAGAGAAPSIEAAAPMLYGVARWWDLRRCVEATGMPLPPTTNAASLDGRCPCVGASPNLAPLAPGHIPPSEAGRSYCWRRLHSYTGAVKYGSTRSS